MTMNFDVDHYLHPTASSMERSQILQILEQVRALQAQNIEVCNLTIGDFDTTYFPIPDGFAEEVQKSYARKETSYPPSAGVASLRKAIANLYSQELNIPCSVDNVCVASGARPPIYATWRLFVGPNEKSVSFLPAWNIGYYAHLNQSNHHFFKTSAESNFHPTAEQVRQALPDCKLIILNTPLNPTGTMIDPTVLEEICWSIVQENKKRVSRPVMLLFDQVYWMLTHGKQHHTPTSLVPEVAPYVIYVDAMSKNFTGTGLRVGWGVVPAAIQPKMTTYLAHMGAWASRPEQEASAWILRSKSQRTAYVQTLKAGILDRLQCLYDGLLDLKSQGYPIEVIPPQGAIYLSMRLDLIGKKFESNEAIRDWLLKQAQIAAVPFQAFDMKEDSGWFRLSVGTASIKALKNALNRLENALRTLGNDL